MKKQKKISFAQTAMLLVGGLLVASCTKNEQTTIVPIGDESYIDSIYSVFTDSLVPDSVFSAFLSAFGSIHEGHVPPNIEGKYLVAPNKRVGTNVQGLPVGTIEPNATLKISKQHNGVAIMELNENIDHVTDTVFIMGNGNDFTIYFIERKHYEVPYATGSFHVSMKRGIVMAGTVTNEGLADFRMASIIMESSDDSNGIMQQDPPGSFFVNKDDDGLAKRLEE